MHPEIIVHRPKPKRTLNTVFSILIVPPVSLAHPPFPTKSQLRAKDPNHIRREKRRLVSIPGVHPTSCVPEACGGVFGNLCSACSFIAGTRGFHQSVTPPFKSLSRATTLRRWWTHKAHPGEYYGHYSSAKRARASRLA